MLNLLIEICPDLEFILRQEKQVNNSPLEDFSKLSSIGFFQDLRKFDSSLYSLEQTSSRKSWPVVIQDTEAVPLPSI